MPYPLTILHTNDIHGAVDGMARAATLIRHIRAERGVDRTLYLDAGDVEETTCRLSNLTKGAGMHRLLNAMHCAAFTVGNAALSRYGPSIVAAHAHVGTYPALLANIRQPDTSPIPGTHDSVTLRLGTARLGVIGVSAPLPDYGFYYGLKLLDLPDVIRAEAAALREAGAHGVVLLSHLGIDRDRVLADELQDDVLAIIGGHSHTLLPDGEWIGTVLVAQARHKAEYVGLVELDFDGQRLSALRAQAIPVPEDVPPDEILVDERRRAEADAEHALDVPVGTLVEPLDFHVDAECGVGNLSADALRAFCGADIAVNCAGAAFNRGLPVGTVTRLALWDTCMTTGNPTVAAMTGAQVRQFLRRGLDPALAGRRPHVLRGQAFGPFHISGAQISNGGVWINGAPLDDATTYRVAGTDLELTADFGYIDAAWELDVQIDVSRMLRDVIEPYLRDNSPLLVATGRIVG